MMMTRIATKTTSSRVIPVVLLATLALAVGVWIAPMPFLTVAKREIIPTPQPGITTPGDTQGLKVNIATHDWIALEAGLRSIRVPAPEVTEPEVAENPTEQNPDDSALPAEHLPPLTWRYVGYIAQPNGRIAAVIETEFGSKIVYVDASLQDTSDPRQRLITVKEVTREQLILRRAGQDITLKIEARQGTEGFDEYGGTDT